MHLRPQCFIISRSDAARTICACSVGDGKQALPSLLTHVFMGIDNKSVGKKLNKIASSAISFYILVNDDALQ